jgi:hypothetical protein
LIGAPVTARTDSAAPPRVAVELGQHDAGQRERVAERLRGVHRVLALHRVDDEQRLDRRNRRVQLGDLLHHRLVDREPTRRVDDQHVVVVRAGPLEGARRDVGWLVRRGRREMVDADLRGQRGELRDRRGAVDVRRGDQHLLLLLAQHARELRGRRRLAGALEAGEQDHGRRPRREVELGGAVAHQRGQLAVHDADQRLARRERAAHLLADGLLAHARDEILDDRQRDIGLEHREAHLAHGVGDVGFGEAGFAAQRLDDARQPFGQLVEHGSPAGAAPVGAPALHLIGAVKSAH